MSKSTRKELFTALGRVEIVNDDRGIQRHRFIPNSPQYLSDQLRGIKSGTKLACTFFQEIPTRSQEQLAYYWIILKYLAEYMGDDDKELHECIMIDLFGTKKKKFNGREYWIRQSIANKALFPKYKMVGLINYTLSICEKMGVKVPTPKELGYQTSEDSEKINNEEFHKGIEKPLGKITF